MNKNRNFVYNLANWEWNILKKLRKTRRKDFLLRLSFLSFSIISILFCIFTPPFALGSLLNAIGVPIYLVNYFRFVFLFIWLWFIIPMSNLKSLNLQKRKNVKNKK